MGLLRRCDRGRSWPLAASLCAVVALAAPSGAQTWLERAELSGDWGGLRGTLADHGIVVGASFTGEVARVLDGGVRERSTFHHLLDLNVTFDLELLAGIEAATFFVDAYQLSGSEVSEDVGDWQAVSNFDSPHMRQVAECWWEQRFLDDALRIKLGKVDANTEFCVAENAGEFLHSSLAVAPTIAVPTYPDPAGAACAFWSFGGDWVAAVGCFDGAGQEGLSTGGRGLRTFLGAPDDLYLISELGTRWCHGEHALAGRAAVGVAHHTGDFSRFDGGTQGASRSLYATLDQQLWREDPSDPEGVQGLTLALLCGLADPDVSEVDRNAAVGLQRTGLFEGRDDDVVGIGLAWAGFAHDAGFGEDEELALELVWKVQVTPWLVVRPDLQYVVHPGGDPALDDAFVGMLRFDVTF